jgi:hypothetical protein
MVFAGALLGAFWSSIGPPIARASTLIADAIVNFGGVVTLALFLIIFALIFGTLLYLFRCRALRAYGVFEIGVGMFVAGVTAMNIAQTSKVGPSMSPVFGVIAALYVIVRGYDNIYKFLSSPAHLAEHPDAIKWWNQVFFRTTDPTKQLN